MNTDYSEEIVAVIRSFLIEDDWKFSFDDERGVFSFELGITSKLNSLKYIIPVKSDSFLVYARAPIKADTDDDEVMHEMAEFICRANYGLRNGNFEFDLSDGELGYKVFVDCDGITPSEAIIRKSVLIPSLMFDRYAPGILGIMFKGSSAEDAISKCE